MGQSQHLPPREMQQGLQSPEAQDESGRRRASRHLKPRDWVNRPDSHACPSELSGRSAIRTRGRVSSCLRASSRPTPPRAVGVDESLASGLPWSWAGLGRREAPPSGQRLRTPDLDACGRLRHRPHARAFHGVEIIATRDTPFSTRACTGLMVVHPGLGQVECRRMTERVDRFGYVWQPASRAR
jgi:hypothetical protein